MNFMIWQLYPRKRNLQYPLGWRLVSTGTGLENREISAPAGNRTQIPQLPVTIMSE
jgi:hypothetical protein